MKSQQQHIVHTATALFGTYGVKAITMDDIAGKCGISKKTLYQSFENKYELLQIVIAELNVHMSQSLNLVRQQSVNAIDEILKTLPVILDVYRSINYRMIEELEKYHFEIWRKVDAFCQQSIKDYILANLHRGQEEGLYHQYFDDELLADFRLQQLILLHTQCSRNSTRANTEKLLWQVSVHYMAGLATTKGRAQLKKLITKYNYDK